jgi:hypothetical protein
MIRLGSLVEQDQENNQKKHHDIGNVGNQLYKHDCLP